MTMNSEHQKRTHANTWSDSSCYGGLSDIGRKRTENQDAFAVVPEIQLYAVSDGMGGGQPGALASQIVTSVLPELLRKQATVLESASARKVRSMLRNAVTELSNEVHRKSMDQPGLKGMGTTVVAALIRHRSAHIVHMGDSRAYLFRKGKLKQLTEDHSVVALLVRNGEITPEEAKTHPARSHLSRFVGIQMEVLPDVGTVSLRKDDRLLLCTDGLTGMLPDKDITNILQEIPDPEAACHALVAAANEAGGKDNITVLLLAPDRLP
jgi:PPM family protein phosphatase